ncbi:linker for activation of T-cells family member 2 [Marmota marmota marmota]|uniref:linker for activation of T-cells family member 2 n=1 Tax=Marmota marmota marmota TaxID=9994 RepID=UPI0020930260|nr:linker for activation of T-cells family member 2 [Marmota marmota marmota]
MSTGTELLWLGAALLLLLLGTAAGLCVRCSRPGLKKAEKIYQQRSLFPCGPQAPSFFHPAPSVPDAPVPRGREQGDPSLGGLPAQEASVKGGLPLTGPPAGYPCVPASSEETEDYQNSASIHQWRESRRAMEQGPIAGHPCPAGSPEEDAGEPDYVNGDVTMTGEA